MTWTYPELVERVQAVLPPGLTVQTQLPADQSAWLAVPVFAYAKQLDEPLPTAAHDIAKRIEALGDVTVEVVGGFVNVTPSASLVQTALTESADPEFGSSSLGNGDAVVIEFSHPNIAKPMGIGHLRSTIIGDALQRIYRALGYQVTSLNHLGDWGTQFGKLIVAYERTFGDLAPRPQRVAELLELYIRFHEEAEADPSLNDQARAMFARLEQGDPAVRSLWQQFVDVSVREFLAMYDRLGVVIDEPTMAESQFEPMVDHLITLAKERGIAEESDGALIVRIPGEEAPLILRKRDDTTIYATRDLAAIHFRIETYQPKKILYVVGNEQALHFRQVFVAAGLLGLVPDGVTLEHVKFGLLRTAEGKLSTRRGRVIFLNDVIQAAVERAKAVLIESPSFAKRGQERFDEDQIDQIAEAVGIAAVKYFDLSHDRTHDIVFDLDRMVNLKGDSAPYLMYSYTRAAAILRKVTQPSRAERETPIEPAEQRDFSPAARNDQSLDLSISRSLVPYIRTLARFPLVLAAVVADNAPHHLAGYLNQLATEFHHFYEQYPVLSAEGDERATRLAIVAATANVLKRGLDLLGIPVLEEM